MKYFFSKLSKILTSTVRDENESFVNFSLGKEMLCLVGVVINYEFKKQDTMTVIGRWVPMNFLRVVTFRVDCGSLTMKNAW